MLSCSVLLVGEPAVEHALGRRAHQLMICCLCDCPTRLMRALACSNVSSLVTGPNQTIVSAAVSVSPCDMHSGWALSTRSFSPPWNSVKILVRSPCGVSPVTLA